MSATPPPTPYLISRIRTFVPMLVGVAATWIEHQLASRYGILLSIDTPTAAVVITGAASGAYYEVARRLEQWQPRLGWLLGYPSEPVYAHAGETIAALVVADTVDGGGEPVIGSVEDAAEAVRVRLQAEDDARRQAASERAAEAAARAVEPPPA